MEHQAWRLPSKLLFISAFILVVSPGSAVASKVGPGAFASPTLIDFESAPLGEINAFYSGLGVTFSNLFGGGDADTGTGKGFSKVATNFPIFSGCPDPHCEDADANFSSNITRAGFYVSTNPEDDLTVRAYNGATLVGSEFFNTGGGGHGGSFAGIEFASGFNRIVFDTTTTSNGALIVDDLRFESGPPSVPEPTSLVVIGLGLMSACLWLWRNRARYELLARA
jgi:hypothetical protein